MWGAIAALTSSGGLVVAVSVLLLGRLDQRRLQASKVAGWFRRVHGENDAHFAVHLANLSDGVVYDVVTRVELLYRDSVVALSERRIGLLTPGQHARFSQLSPLDRHAGSPDPDPSGLTDSGLGQPAPLRLWFTDSAGRRWHRDGRGALHRVRTYRSLTRPRDLPP